jgi:transcriptional regulator with XRE-family HTH domain
VSAGRARHLIAKLEDAGLSRGEIAQRAGVSAATISRLSKSKTKRASRITVAAVMKLVP